MKWTHLEDLMEKKKKKETRPDDERRSLKDSSNS